MRRIGCCLVYGSCCESRFPLSFLRASPANDKDTLWCVAAYAARRRGHVPGCLLRKGGDVPGKEVSDANGGLTSLPFRQAASPCLLVSFASLAQP
ncbi:hypothetical protein ACFQ5D_20985 [Paenibacillus farraposensis]|uniref:Secreted protein n=2 Tax=Paenibacillus farraposensis TaxID=2807095 RepID=A0ABW4DGH6_9BACL|nr:hypothetical protein [Paenibacillus farraposensis]MCC3382306.1 hypothetical protein [Paenibacillus farraposensis]